MIRGAYPKMRRVLFDLPHVFEGGQRAIAAAGLSNRCEVVSGHFFRSVPVGGAAYILSRVIHDWVDEKAIAISKVVRGALADTGRLLLSETTAGCTRSDMDTEACSTLLEHHQRLLRLSCVTQHACTTSRYFLHVVGSEQHDAAEGVAGILCPDVASSERKSKFHVQ